MPFIDFIHSLQINFTVSEYDFDSNIHIYLCTHETHFPFASFFYYVVHKMFSFQEGKKLHIKQLHYTLIASHVLVNGDFFFLFFFFYPLILSLIIKTYSRAEHNADDHIQPEGMARVNIMLQSSFYFSLECCSPYGKTQHAFTYC